MLEIGTSFSCNGCHACFSVCPVDAIAMQADWEGFLRPSIDTDKCILCGKCEKVCPILNPLIIENNLQEAYACYNLDETIRLDSSSGGMFTLLAEKIIKKDGLVFGAIFDSSFNVVHSCTKSVEGLTAFRGSKYVQSNINTTFKECKKALKEDRWVLFSGTPCQIAGLLSFLEKPYEKLFCIDIVCHGVPSPLLWEKYKNEKEAEFKSNVVRTSFRHKNYGWKMFSLLFAFTNNNEYSKTLKKDAYMQLFLHDLCLRHSCYDCKFKTVNRLSDITLADFWGIQNIAPEIDDDKGTSFLIIHSKKGKEFFASLSNVKEKKIDIKDGIRFNSSMIKSCSKPKKRAVFFKYVKKHSVEELKKKFVKINIRKKIKSYIYKMLKAFIGDKGIQKIKKVLGK